ncbi:MAG: hypothetical protein ACI4EJ_00570 [Bacteroides sp.]
MEQQLFIEALENLRIFAKSNDNKVSKNDVLDCIGHDIELDDEKWQMIAGYLKSNQIELTDVKLTDDKFGKMLEESEKMQVQEDTPAENVTDAQEEQLLSMYLEDLKSIVPLSRTTQAVILQDVCDKDVESRNVIINNYFLQIVDWVRPYAGKGVALMDLIQEGNVVVMDELGKRDWMKELDAFDVMDSGNIDDWTDLSVRLDSYIIERVERSVNRLIEEQTGEKMAGNKILSKVNLVNDAAQKAYKEYGRKLTAAELAEFMHVAEDEVKEALRLSANKIENVIVPD